MSNHTRRQWVLAACVVLALGLVLVPDVAHAATGGGGGLPWDQPLQRIQQDLTGPVAFTISLLGFFCCGCALVFGGEMNEFVRRLIMAVMVMAMLVAVVNFASAIGIAGALVL